MKPQTQVHEEEVSIGGVKKALGALTEALKKADFNGTDAQVAMALMLHITGSPELYMFLGRQFYEDYQANKNKPEAPPPAPSNEVH